MTAGANPNDDSTHTAPCSARRGEISVGESNAARPPVYWDPRRAASKLSPTRAPSIPATNPDSFDPSAIAETLRSLSPDPERPDLYQVARALGVRSITTSSALDRAGHTSWSQGIPDIILQRGQSLSRRRFTLAHELAHTFLRHGITDISDPEPGAPARPNFRREEWQADAVAGCLLVPEHAVARLREMRSQDEARIATLSDVRRAAEMYQVSNSVVVRRLSDLDRSHPWLLVNFKQSQDGSWLTWRVIGRIRGLDSKLGILESNFPTFDRLPQRDVRVRFLARFDNHVFELTGTGNRQRDLVFVLVDHARRVGGTDTTAHRIPIGAHQDTDRKPATSTQPITAAPQATPTAWQWRGDSSSRDLDRLRSPSADRH